MNPDSSQPDANRYALVGSYMNDYWGSELAVVPGAGVLFLSSQALEICPQSSSEPKRRW